MTFELPKLPFELNALEPFISKETLEYHHGKHHKAYVNKLNELIINTEFENKTLEDIIKTSSGGIFNNAAQHFNHTFYWNCLKLKQQPPNTIIQALINTFGSFEKFKKQFTNVALTTFGSGWTWLIKNEKDKLEIVSTSNANTPIKNNHKVLLTCDVWEHAYYIDYRNARAKYLEAFWEIVNWEFINSIFTKIS